LANDTTIVERIFNAKNVFNAFLISEEGEEKKVVLKKLGHDHELDDLDNAICLMTNQ